MVFSAPGHYIAHMNNAKGESTRNAYAYTPTMPASDWHAIAPFVIACVDASSTSTRYGKPELSAAAAPLTRWAVRHAGLPLDPTAIFDRDVIDRFVSTSDQYRTKASKNTIRSRLLRISEALLTPDAIVEALRPLGSSDPSAPYSLAEQIALRSWAASQPTAEKRRSAGALLALGMGAGLSGKEIIECRRSDLLADEAGVVVTVRGSRTREVPVLREWEDALALLASDRDLGRPAFREGQSGVNPNLITDFVSRSRGKIALQARRMRATWIVRHLTEGTPILAVREAAGVHTLEAFDRFVELAESPQWDSVRESLRGRPLIPCERTDS